MKLTVRHDSCPVCSGSIRHWRSKKVGEDEFKIDHCSACDFAFVNPRPDKSTLREFYSSAAPDGISTVCEALQREEEYPNSKLDARRIISTLGRLHGKTGSLLDVGSGHGFFTREATRQGFDVKAIELGRFERECTETLSGIKPLDIAFEEYLPEGERYDCILMSQILEHVSNINDWVVRAHELLLDKGLLCVALPNFNSLVRLITGERDPYITPPVHLNFFTRSSLSTLVRKHGFEVLEIEEVSRLPGDLLSRRVHVGGLIKRGIERGTQLTAATYSLVADHLRMGIMVNLYCRKK